MDFLHDDSGVTLLEYSLVAASVALVAMLAVNVSGDAIRTWFAAILAAVS